MRKSLVLSMFVACTCLAQQVYAQDAVETPAEAQNDQIAAESNESASEDQAESTIDASDAASDSTSDVSVSESEAQPREVQAASANNTVIQSTPNADQPWAIPSGADVLSAKTDSVSGDGDSTADKVLNYINDRFRFGSYGRVQPSMNPADLSSGRQISIVSPRPRVDEGTYVELTLGYTPYRDEDGTEVEVLTTLALDGNKLFHFDGDWDANLAIRNLYVEARNLWIDGLTLWAGSRMYRGDDIYLLDFWPLDNLNTYGGGIGWHGSTRTNVDLHFGTNRLDSDYQLEVIPTESSRFIGQEDVVYLDRQRFIASLKAEQQFGTGGIDDKDSIQFKVKAYGEIHSIKSGEYIEFQPEAVKELPDDFGWLVGAEFGMWNFLDDSYVTLFLKYAEGLAAYGEMTVPYGVGADLKARDAKQFLFGLSTGLDFKYVNVLAAGYVRYFADADGVEEDFDDGVDGVWDVRITGRIGKYFAPGIELSQQLRHANGLNPETLSQDLASVFKFSLLPGVRFGEGMLARPEIRLNYTVSVLNDAARDMFNSYDKLRQDKVQHFLGIAAEWWFNL